MAAGKPLDGLRVVDFTWVLAGPFANRILGDLGADILKFQTAERATLVNSPDFPYFYVWNRSKRLVSLDMKRPEALAVIRAVVEQSDILMENFSAGVLDRWGIGYEQVREWNPGIIYLTMSGPGHEGPWSKMITYAPTIHALCGLTYLSNPAGRRDVGPGFSLNDHAAGLCAAAAVLAAVEARRRTGEGQHVDIAQMETGTYLIGPAVLDLLANGREAHPIGNRDPFGDVVPERRVPLRRSARGGDHVPRRRRLGAAVRHRVVGHRRPRRRPRPGHGGRPPRPRRRDRRAAARLVRQPRCRRRRRGAAGQRRAGRQGAGRRRPDGRPAARRPRLLAPLRPRRVRERPYDRFPALWSTSDLEPYLPSGAFIGEHNFEVYRDLAGMSEDDIAIGMSDGLFG